MTDRQTDVFDDLAQKMIDQFAGRVSDETNELRGLPLGSPIEAKFLASFMFGEHCEVYHPDSNCPIVLGDETDCIHRVYPQWKMGRYRVDFLIEYIAIYIPGRPVLARVVVECDGHDFHERTKEQARRDRARDRAIQQQGLMVLRFTGSEIFRDVESCVRETRKALFRLSRDEEHRLQADQELASLRKLTR